MRWLFVFTFISTSCFAQNSFLVNVKLLDKSNSKFSIDQPQQFLSQRAIDRRVRQNIPINWSDVPVNSNYIETIRKVSGVKFRYASKWLNSIVIETPDTLPLERIRSYEFVASVEVISNPYHKKEPVNKWGEYKSQEEIDYGSAEAQLIIHELDKLHRKGYMGEGMQIAVFDAGFNGVDTLDAFEYMRNGNLLGMRDFVKPDMTDFYDHGHGRSVLSTMAVNQPGIYVGAAPEASYYLFRTEDGNSESLIEEYNWLAAAEYADSLGVDVINSSLGYTRFDDPLENHSYETLDGNTTIITKAADWAASKGIIVVNSAGNSGTNQWHYISAPADADSILSVAAVGVDSTRASFSSFGPRVDLVVKPDVAAVGFLTQVIDGDGDTKGSNGTSFSSPIIAGSVACLWQAFPNLSNMKIIDIVKQFSHQYSNPDSLLGYGIPNFYNAYIELKDRNINLLIDFVEVYPNPVTDEFYANYYSTDELDVDISVYSISGSLCWQSSFYAQKGVNRLVIPIDWSTLSKGCYIVQFNNGRDLLTDRVVKF